MINPFIVKKWGALLLTGLLTTVGFFMGLKFYGFGLMSFVFMGAGLMLGAVIGNKLLDNPFRLMLEGKGVMLLDISSTGIIQPFIMRVLPPYITGKIHNRLKSTVFNRSMVYNFATPQEAGFIQQGQGEDKQVRTAIVLDEEEYNRGRFGFLHYPCIIWNSQIDSPITKDFLSEQEKTTFAEHGVLYLNRKMEELTSAIRDFGRHVVESLKPKNFLSGSSLIWIIVIIVFVILLIVFAPKLIPALQGAAGSVGNAATNVQGAVQTAGG